MPLQKKSVLQYRQIGFTQAASLQVNLVGWWDSAYEHPIYLLSNLEDKHQTCRYYRRRYRIETFFSDQKSRGFHIHKSHLSDPARVSRLLLAACLAYIWMILQGLQVIDQNQIGWIDRTDRRDKSLFRLGLDWPRHCPKRDWDFEPLFWSQPEPSLLMYGRESKDTFKRKRMGRDSTIPRQDFLEWTKSIWNIPAVSARKIGHPAPFPEELPHRLIQLYAFKGEVVLDPFVGSGTTCVSAKVDGRRYVGYEVNEEYIRLAEERLRSGA